MHDFECLIAALIDYVIVIRIRNSINCAALFQVCIKTVIL